MDEIPQKAMVVDEKKIKIKQLGYRITTK
jgi:ABC-type polysaccharide/polyol phosphate transport system ATPase subunit